MNDDPAAAARRTQRLGAYAVVVRPDASGVAHLLITRISPVGFPPGSWALPGGGVDHGESPAAAVRRELHEETGLEAASVRLVDVHDVHTVAPGRGDRWEDYHGVHLVYAVELAGAGAGLPRPTVLDVGGSTDLATWLPVHDLVRDASRPLLPLVTHVLARLADYAPGTGGSANSTA